MKIYIKFYPDVSKLVEILLDNGYNGVTVSKINEDEYVVEFEKKYKDENICR